MYIYLYVRIYIYIYVYICIRVPQVMLGCRYYSFEFITRICVKSDTPDKGGQVSER